jgi:hypothetical protein
MKNFFMPVAISMSLLLVCLANVLTKPDRDLQWEKQTISVIFAYWVAPPQTTKKEEGK